MLPLLLGTGNDIPQREGQIQADREKEGQRVYDSVTPTDR